MDESTYMVSILNDSISNDLLLNKISLYNETYNNINSTDNTEIEYSLHDSTELYRNYNFNMLLNDVTEQEAKTLALNWTAKRIISFYIHIDTVSYYDDYKIPIYMYDKIFEEYKKEIAIIYENDFKMSNYSFLGVLEKSPNKGFHLHLLVLSTLILNKKRVDKILKNFETRTIMYSIIHNNQEGTINDNDYMRKFPIITNADIVKSPGGIFHYLQKNPLKVYCDKFELVKMFMYFKKEYIFPAGTQAKYQKLKTNTLTLTKDPLTILFFNMFNEGILDYNDIIQDVRLQPYLSKPSLKVIYTNVFANFSASLNHIKNLLMICNKYKLLDIKQRCACSVIEFFRYQNIDINLALEHMFKWLTCCSKRNCLWFHGPADCGKSHLARLIWKCFILNTRIVSDGIFSFANLLKSGCALWDEPFIGPDLADQTKLVLEGEPDIDITIKNKGSERLGKRVPIIITSNSYLWKYCTAEKVPFEKRTFLFSFTKPIDSFYFCKETEHYCSFLDTQHSTFNPFTDNERIQNNKRRRSSETRVFNCEKNHSIEQNHVLSFIILSLLRYKQHFTIDSTLGTPEEYQLLADNLKSFENTLCHCSSTLYNKLDNA